MASKGNKKTQINLKAAKNDERYPKLGGLVMVLFAFYLCIAFFSYLFTWQADQDLVLHHSWDLLFDSSIVVQNALGRLGALLSHIFFYNLFGLTSFAFVYLLAVFGIQLITDKSSDTFSRNAIRLIIVVLWLSIFIEFFFGGGTFPVGGAFGKMIETWLQKFIGVIGLLFLFLFSIVAVTIWLQFPQFKLSDLRNWTFDLILWVNHNLPDRWRKYIKIPPRVEEYLENKRREQARHENEARRKAAELARKEATSEKIPPPPPATEPLLPGKQLKLELSKDSIPPAPTSEPLQVGEEGDLEIVSPAQGGGAIPNDFNIAEENQQHIEPYDPTLELSSYQSPTFELLDDYDEHRIEIDRTELEANKDQIIETLLNYKIEITKIKATIGPTVTLYEIVPAPGVRISKIKNLEDDIALSLSALGIRIIAPIPGKGTIGIEVPNKKKQVVALKDLLSSSKFKEAKMDLPIALGKTIANEVFVADLAKMPHLLIAGATGQGKSVGINVVLMSLLYKKHPSQVKLVLIDPKKVELSPYSKIENHFLGYLPGVAEPIVTDTEKVVDTLNSLCIEMEQRYDLLKRAEVRNIREYNQKFVKRRLNPDKGHYFMPYIVLVIDEFADLIMTAGKEIELPIGRLAQLARAVGIHLIIATQRPSVNIITGVIKANFPARIAYKVTSKIDSRTILDGSGAEQLIGRGDMLLSVGGSSTIRLQCAFVDTPEVERVVDFIAQQRGYPEPFLLPEYSSQESELSQGGVKYSDLDEMFIDAARLIVENQLGSTSMLQRRLKLGYNRAGRLMDQLEAVGIVGPNEGSKPREVLIYDMMELERYLEQLKNM